MKERKEERKKDRQTDRQTDIQTDGYTYEEKTKIHLHRESITATFLVPKKVK